MTATVENAGLCVAPPSIVVESDKRDRIRTPKPLPKKAGQVAVGLVCGSERPAMACFSSLKTCSGDLSEGFDALRSIGMRNIVVHSFSVLLVVICCNLGSAQTSFTEETEGYVFELPSTMWRALPRPDGIHGHTDFTHGPDSDVRLRIRLKMVDENTLPEAIADRDEERRLRFLPGFVDSKREQFIGKVSGVITSYEYIRGGKPVAARVYYLRANTRIIYVLRFTGTRAALKEILGQTDSIAHSFHLR